MTESDVTHPFHDLLFNPPGEFYLTPFGNTHVVTLVGGREFRRFNYNLFASFSKVGNLTIHRTNDENVIWFCATPENVRQSLQAHLFAAAFKRNARSMVDDEGDFVEVVCDGEDALWEKAGQDACDFIVQHMPPRWRELTYKGHHFVAVEYGTGYVRSTNQPGGGRDDD